MDFLKEKVICTNISGRLEIDGINSEESRKEVDSSGSNVEGNG